MDAFRCPDLVVCLPFGYNTKPIAEPATTQQHKGLDWTDCANYHPTAVHSSVKPLTSDLRPNIPNCLRASTNKRFHQNTPLLQIYSIAADITTAHYTHNQLRTSAAPALLSPAQETKKGHRQRFLLSYLLFSGQQFPAAIPVLRDHSHSIAVNTLALLFINSAALQLQKQAVEARLCRVQPKFDCGYQSNLLNSIHLPSPLSSLSSSLFRLFFFRLFL
ncbi:hypothetical protein CI102_11690 [Trichoderma harzianum]|nr:hypothetical protein CI102_11690 [Trichoderma harzianum]